MKKKPSDCSPAEVEATIQNWPNNPPRKRAPGGGRKKKDEADKAVNVNMSMLPAERDQLDALRGKTPRGRFVAGRLKL